MESKKLYAVLITAVIIAAFTPIVFAASCFVSHPESVNLGISLLVSGASAFIGATRTSYTSVGWTQPAHGGHNTYCYDFTDRIANKNEDCGHALYNAKQYVYNNYPWNLWYDNANMYNFNLYGDPSMGMNLAPFTPIQPTGATTGIAGFQYTYSTVAFDPTGDIIKYGWDWNGDGTTDEWTSLSTSGVIISTPHIFTSTGTYNIKVIAEDEHGAQSSFSSALPVTIASNPPNKPSRPTGSASGKPGVSYTYQTSTTDPDGDQLYYMWDWGDRTPLNWTGPYNSGQTITASHIWSAKGAYSVKVKAKDTTGAESVWSDPLPITMPYSFNKPILQFFDWLFQRFPNAFPILRQLLGY